MTKRVNYFASAKALKSRTPTWAKNMFRITFVVTSAFTLFMAGTNLVDESVKYEVILVLKAIDALIFGLSKMFGVAVEETDN